MSTAHQPPCLAAAHDYLQRGWSPIPLCPWDHAGVSGDHQTSCQTPGKRPYFEWKQYQDKRPAPAHLNLSWNRNQDFNVGICLGPVSGLIGLDIDGVDGEELLNDWRAGEIIPPTLEFATPGGGRRLLFKHPPETVKIKSHQANQHEAIRILAKGSQTVAPPSRHATGGHYVWIPGRAPGDIEPAECPEWLLMQLAQKSEVGGQKPEVGGQKSDVGSQKSDVDVIARARAFLATCEPAVSHHGGHDKTITIANRLVKGFALPEEMALQLLLAEYNPRCQPPWSEKELRHKITDALKSSAMMGYMLNEPPNGHGPINHKDPGQHQAVTRPFKNVTVRQVEWLWPGWIPLGKLAILDGDPGLGKSTLLLDLAARVSLGGLMPNGVQGQAGNVIIMSAEDAAEDTILPRLNVAGANIDRIHELSHMAGPDERPIQLPDDIPHIRTQIQKLEARLLIVDPLMAFLGRVDANKDADIRKVLFKLSRVAEQLRCAIICMRHLNKGSGTKAIYRGNSSIGVIGHARTGLIVAEDPDDNHRRVLAATKCNLGKKPESLNFSLEPVGDVCRIGWAGPCSYNADQLLAQPTPEQQEQKANSQTKLETALQILEWMFEASETGLVSIAEAKKELASAGLAHSTVDRAVQKLGLAVSYSVEDGKRVYYWSKTT